MPDFLTGEEIPSAISQILSNNFNQDEIKTIYINKPEQFAEESKPYAFVSVATVLQTRDLKPHSNRSYIVTVRVHPKTYQSDINTWGLKLGEKLLYHLKDITVKDYPVRAISMEYRLVDEVLVFDATYRLRVVDFVDKTDNNFMETLDLNFYGERGN